MKCRALVFFALAAFARSNAQTTTQDISPASRHEAIKAEANSAYARQMESTGKLCQAEAARGQQPYNICIGQADEAADRDLAVFYNNLQMLCHDPNQLAALQESEKSWRTYSQSAMKATHAAWPQGTGAPGFAGEVYLSLVRDHMRELHEIYALDITQSLTSQLGLTPK